MSSEQIMYTGYDILSPLEQTTSMKRSIWLCNYILYNKNRIEKQIKDRPQLDI